MEAPAYPKPTQDKTPKDWMMALTMLLPLMLPLAMGNPHNPHAPQKLTWQVSSANGDVIWSTTHTAPPWTWWPSLYPDLCLLAAGLDSWDVPEIDPASPPKPESRGQCPGAGMGGRGFGCSHPQYRAELRTKDVYACPRNGRSRSETRRCGGTNSFFCKEWGCETTGNTYWKPRSSWDLITLTKGHLGTGLTKDHCQMHYGRNTGIWTGEGACTNFTCNPLNISFTDKGKENRTWVKGNQWGIRVYVAGYDNGLLLTIRLKIEAPDPLPLGPNPVLTNQGPASRPALPPPSPMMEVNETTPEPLSPPPPMEQRLMNLILGAFLALNQTDPGQTTSCWLCLTTSPPYYEGIAMMGTYNNTTSANSCHGTPPSLTLTEVTGQGTCIGNPPQSHQKLCNSTAPIPSTPFYLVPPPGIWWACNKGLTPCISTQVLKDTNDFCMAQVMPRILYHRGGGVLEDHYDPHLTRYRREPISLTLAVMLGLGMATGVGTGTSALVSGNQQYWALQTAVDEDLRTLEQSVSKLEQLLTSLSEVVLQNRRGLDLLFLKEGGLCAALGEECCFYADHSGIVRDSMAKLRERLNKRQRDREGQQGWFEGWFNRSPWMTTLISTLLGPLIILLLLLTFGPCILNRLLQFIRDRLSITQALVLTQQYQAQHTIDNLL